MAQTHTPPGEVVANARVNVGWKPVDLITEVRRSLGKHRAFSEATLRNIESGRTRKPDIHIAHAIVYVLNRADPDLGLAVADLWPGAR